MQEADDMQIVAGSWDDEDEDNFEDDDDEPQREEESGDTKNQGIFFSESEAHAHCTRCVGWGGAYAHHNCVRLFYKNSTKHDVGRGSCQETAETLQGSEVCG